MAQPPAHFLLHEGPHPGSLRELEPQAVKEGKATLCLIKDLKMYIFKILFFNYRWISGVGGSLYKYIIKIVSLFCFCPGYKVVRLL